MYCIQDYEDPDVRTTILPAIIQPKKSSARNCFVPPCQPCLFARAKKRSPTVSRTQPLEDREGAITRDQCEVGDFVSTDQFICKTPDVCRLGMDRNHKTAVFRAAPYIMAQHQAGAIETVMGKAHFEQWLWNQCVSEVKHYHGDSGIFSAEEYHHDCDEKGQSQSFSGVGTQHQNARAERAIQTIMYMT
jgi:hypothetical protein